MSARLARCDPRLLDFVTWTVLKGCRLFQRVHVTSLGLIATSTIPAYDFVAVVPTSATLSVLSLAEDQSFPLKVSPQNHSEPLAFWPDLTLGSFALVGYLARALHTGSPRGVSSYLRVLPLNQDMPVGSVVDAAQKSSGYRELIEPVQNACKAQQSDFDLAFRHAYCLFRQHAVPFWSYSEGIGRGHPDFQLSPFVEGGCGDIVGLIPVLDLASHSPEPNAAIGYPDADMLHWLVQEKKTCVPNNRGYFVLQAQRDIHEGEMITTDKNAYFNFDDATFEAWFGYPNTPQVCRNAENAGISTTICNYIEEPESQEFADMPR